MHFSDIHIFYTSNILFIATDKVNVNEAMIIESEVFVYNLGTMFYIDKMLFTSKSPLPTTTAGDVGLTTSEPIFTTAMEVEHVPPKEASEESGVLPDVLFADAGAATVSTDIPPEVIKSATAKNETIK